MLIALIDDKINPKYIMRIKSIKTYVIDKNVLISKPRNWDENQKTHATCCLKVLENIVSDIEILHIEIMQGSNKLGNIYDLVRALEFSVEKGVDIISLSIGSTRLSDTVILHPVVKRAADKGIIIIAAQSNNGYITIPAAYSETIGVMSLDRNTFLHSQIYRMPKNHLGIDVGVVVPEYKGNSFAVPEVTGRVCEVLKNNDCIRNNVSIYNKICSNNYFIDENYFNKCIHQYKNYPIPLILVKSKWEGLYDFLVSLMNYLSEQYFIETLCVMQNKRGADVRFVQYEYKNFYENVDNNYNSDIDILIITEEDMLGIERLSNIDIELQIKKDSAILLVSESEERRYFSTEDDKKIGDCIISILT